MLKRFVWAMTIVLVGSFASVGISQDANKADRAKQIRKEIGELKKKIADLEKELEAAEPLPYIGPDKGNNKFSLKVGDVGGFGDHRYRVLEVIGSNNSLIAMAGDLKFLVAAPCPGVADDGHVKLEGEWEIALGTGRGGRKIFWATPRKGAKVVPD